MTSSSTDSQYTGGAEPRLSMATENYLLSIFRLEEREVRVTLTQLAEHLKTLPEDEGMGTSLPSVGGMIRRMIREDLAQTAPNKDVLLTPRGLKSAESIVRRHRLAERMLVEILKVDWHKAHREAHRLEHAISLDVEERMAQALNYPKTNPYGKPIPGYCDSLPSDRSLSNALEGEDAFIEQVPEDDMRLLKFFDDNGIRPGAKVKIKELAPYKGTVSICLDDNEVILGFEIADKIKIQGKCIPQGN